MLRRLALLAGLLAPLSAWAQTAGNIAFTPKDTYGSSACVVNSTQISMTWTVAFVSTTTAVPTGSTYRVLASNQADCPATGTAGAITGDVVSSTSATGQTQTYPGTGDPLLYVSDLVSLAGLSCSAADTVVHVCVRLIPSGGGLADSVGNAQSVVSLQLAAPPVPVLTDVQPAESGLWVYWTDGTANGTTASSYKVTAIGLDPVLDAGTHTGSTSSKSLRLGGLHNGVNYDVTVQAVSAGGNISAASNKLTNSPQPVNGFWESYQAAGGTEQGGCAGGAGGLLSLALLAGLGRILRRRS